MPEKPGSFTPKGDTGITLYQANLRTYQLLRYGVPVQIAAGKTHETVHLMTGRTPSTTTSRSPRR